MNSETEAGAGRLIRVGDKMLRCGYTTGSCAAAAAQGAVLMLATGIAPESVTIDTPSGQELRLQLEDCSPGALRASCAVRKDGGDDPDATDGLLIYASAEYTGGHGIEFAAGDGVGTVTKKGLQIPPGEPAINPVPRQMIEHEVRRALDKIGKNPDAGIRITVSVPGGAEIAARTFNPRLGIEGGLSILGTSGIVVPMSEDALTESMRLELSVRKEKRVSDGKPLSVVYVPGNYGADFAGSLGIDRDSAVRISNYAGFMLDEARSLGFTKILLVGDLGKLVKIAGGCFQTHSAVSDARVEILTANAALLGADRDVLAKIMECPTTAAAADIIREAGLDNLWQVLADKIRLRCQRRVFGEIEVGVVLFERGYGLLAQTENAAGMIDGAKAECEA